MKYSREGQGRRTDVGTSQWLRRLSSLAAVAMVTCASVATTASAAGPTTRKETGMYRSADTRSGRLLTVPAEAAVTIKCWRAGGGVTGETSKNWFRGSYGGKTGWFYANRVEEVPSQPRCADLLPGETLFSGQAVRSGDGNSVITMQTDGNVVLRNGSGVLWATRTSGSGTRLVQQGDGNLVVYRSDGRPVWNTGVLISGTKTVMQNDSNLVSYTGSRAVFASGWHRQIGRTNGSNQGAPGNCTWFVNEEFKKFTGKYPYSYVPSGRAADWDTELKKNGWRVGTTPGTQAIVVFEPNVQGAGSWGHVAWAYQMRKNSAGAIEVRVKEMNWNGLYRTNDRWVKHVSGMSYVYASWRA